MGSGQAPRSHREQAFHWDVVPVGRDMIDYLFTGLNVNVVSPVQTYGRELIGYE